MSKIEYSQLQSHINQTNSKSIDAKNKRSKFILLSILCAAILLLTLLQFKPIVAFLQNLFTSSGKSATQNNGYNKEILENDVSNQTVMIDVGDSKKDNQDTDQDGLPDSLENYFYTDPLNSDTDGDSFLDGTEVQNGYNPH